MTKDLNEKDLRNISGGGTTADPKKADPHKPSSGGQGPDLNAPIADE